MEGPPPAAVGQHRSLTAAGAAQRQFRAPAGQSVAATKEQLGLPPSAPLATKKGVPLDDGASLEAGGLVDGDTVYMMGATAGDATTWSMERVGDMEGAPTASAMAPSAAAVAPAAVASAGEAAPAVTASGVAVDENVRAEVREDAAEMADALVDAPGAMPLTLVTPTEAAPQLAEARRKSVHALQPNESGARYCEPSAVSAPSAVSVTSIPEEEEHTAFEAMPAQTVGQVKEQLGLPPSTPLTDRAGTPLANELTVRAAGLQAGDEVYFSRGSTPAAGAEHGAPPAEASRPSSVRLTLVESAPRGSSVATPRSSSVTPAEANDERVMTPFEAPAERTIGGVKEQLGLPPSTPLTTKEGTALDDGASLFEAGLSDGDTLHLDRAATPAAPLAAAAPAAQPAAAADHPHVVAPPPPDELELILIRGTVSTPFVAQVWQTIGEVKEGLGLGPSTPLSRVTGGGGPLQNDRTVKECGLITGDMVQAPDDGSSPRRGAPALGMPPLEMPPPIASPLSRPLPAVTAPLVEREASNSPRRASSALPVLPAVKSPERVPSPDALPSARAEVNARPMRRLSLVRPGRAPEPFTTPIGNTMAQVKGQLGLPLSVQLTNADGDTLDDGATIAGAGLINDDEIRLPAAPAAAAPPPPQEAWAQQTAKSVLQLVLVYADGSGSHRAKMKFTCSIAKSFEECKEQLGLPRSVLLTNHSGARFPDAMKLGDSGLLDGESVFIRAGRAASPSKPHGGLVGNVTDIAGVKKESMAPESAPETLPPRNSPSPELEQMSPSEDDLLAEHVKRMEGSRRGFRMSDTSTGHSFGTTNLAWMTTHPYAWQFGARRWNQEGWSSPPPHAHGRISPPPGGGASPAASGSPSAARAPPPTAPPLYSPPGPVDVTDGVAAPLKLMVSSSASKAGLPTTVRKPKPNK